MFFISGWPGEEFDDGKDFEISIENQKVKLINLNANVLECTLPKFDCNPQNQNLNTFIYLYKNNELYTDPIPFEIKFDCKQSNSQKGSLFSHQIFI